MVLISSRQSSSIEWSDDTSLMFPVKHVLALQVTAMQATSADRPVEAALDAFRTFSDLVETSQPGVCKVRGQVLL